MVLVKRKQVSTSSLVDFPTITSRIAFHSREFNKFLSAPTSCMICMKHTISVRGLRSTSTWCGAGPSTGLIYVQLSPQSNSILSTFCKPNHVTCKSVQALLECASHQDMQLFLLRVVCFSISI